MDLAESVVTFDPPLTLLRDEHVAFSIGVSKKRRTCDRILDEEILLDE